ncbi:hypothetical protein K470DRAFT_11330 [Piedraia hortae CBS 480.64]|uniref:Uncharacterized protein n=1 Tax=Piedraia hortae CBS 480.64 TaxID=1314780 RepID=A0A6A7C658_9PEZI|nr:hypothetical protein K470DRAFT_11330 [Piedraia hortae CBS 480.64]
MANEALRTITCLLENVPLWLNQLDSIPVSAFPAAAAAPAAAKATTTEVYYNGPSQKTLEFIVRNVGSLRSELRTGRMSARIELRSRIWDRDAATVREHDHVSRTLELVESALEKAQALCEAAAFEMLRTGHHEGGIAKARDCLIEAMTLAKAEVAPLRDRATTALGDKVDQAPVAPAVSAEETLEVTSDSDEDEDYMLPERLR